jgi:hypothetical protein
MYVPAWPLPGNGYMTLIRNGSVTTNISTAKIDRGINIYLGNADESASKLYSQTQDRIPTKK